MLLVGMKALAGRRIVVIGIVLALLLASCIALWLGPGPAAHHVTRFEAQKIAETHLLQAGEPSNIQAKLVRQWQLTLMDANDGGHIWSNQLVWLVLVPGGHFSAAGCCVATKFTWNIAVINDNPGGAELDGVLAGATGGGPPWYWLLPDLSGSRQ
jgi:hypothetical protein